MNIEDILPRDAIPSVDDPSFGPDYFGDADDDMLVLDSEPPRAYPLRVLSYHEIVNDSVDGRPVAVTWCPICASAVAYDRTVDGQVLTFGVSGKLADDALVMYDRETESEWKQSSGECIAGEFEDRTLDVLPTAVITWSQFASEYSDGVVLEPAPGRDASEYDMEPYERYFDTEGFGVGEMRGTGPGRDWDRTDLDAKTTVLGVESDDEAVGYPLPVVESEGGVVQDTVGNLEVVIFAADGELHAFRNEGYQFSRTTDGFAADGTVWDGTTGESADGRQLQRIPAHRLFAFAWQDDHGRDAFYGH